MSEVQTWKPAASRRWTKRILALAGVWVAAGWLIVPAIIRSAFDDGLFAFLGWLMPGRSRHAVDVYLGSWADLSAVVLLGLAAIWLAGLIVIQPLAWRLVRAAYLRVPTIGGRFRRRTVAVLLALVSITVVVQANDFNDRWETARGHEYERIATSLTDGQGFSFPPERKWLILESEPVDAEYSATAWKEPVYPHFMAASFSLLGPRYGRLWVVLCQIGFLLVTSVLIYRMGTDMFGAGVGIAAALATGLSLDLHFIYTTKMQVPAISSLLLVGGLLLLHRYGEQPSARRAGWLGLYLGLAALTHAVLFVLVPIAGLFILLHSGRRSWWGGVQPALLMGLVAALAISPWTVRNYVEFGHVIPVQTGFGLFTNVSNPYLAETYLAELDACGDGSPPVYRATGPFDAVRSFRAEDETIHAVHRRSVACVAAAHADEYTSLNEHERDGLHEKQVVTFAAQYPLQFLELTAAKALLFIFDAPIDGRGSPPLAALGLVGMLLIVRKPRMWIFPVAILAYAAPFALGAPMYFRYQAPLKPVFCLLAVVALVTILRGPFERLTRSWGLEKDSW